MQGALEVRVTFTPSAAGEVAVRVWCHLEGHAAAVPLWLCGTGTGPVLSFPYHVLDVGAIFLHGPHMVTLDLQNKCVSVRHLLPGCWSASTKDGGGKPCYVAGWRTQDSPLGKRAPCLGGKQHTDRYGTPMTDLPWRFCP